MRPGGPCGRSRRNASQEYKIFWILEIETSGLRLPTRSKVGAYRMHRLARAKTAHYSYPRNRRITNKVGKNKLYLQVVDAVYDDHVGKALACPEYTGLSGMRERARLQGG